MEPEGEPKVEPGQREVGKASWLKTLVFFCLQLSALILLTKLTKKSAEPKGRKNLGFFLIITPNYIDRVILDVLDLT